MTTFMHKSIARKAPRRESAAAHTQVLALRATHRGWSLVGPRGEVVFDAAGPEGRHECLAFALDHGVLALTS